MKAIYKAHVYDCVNSVYNVRGYVKTAYTFNALGDLLPIKFVQTTKFTIRLKHHAENVLVKYYE